MFARGCEGSCSVNTRCLPGACLLKARSASGAAVFSGGLSGK